MCQGNHPFNTLWGYWYRVMLLSTFPDIEQDLKLKHLVSNRRELRILSPDGRDKELKSLLKEKRFQVEHDLFLCVF